MLANQTRPSVLQEYIARFGHGSAKLARQAQSKEKTLEKMVSLGATCLRDLHQRYSAYGRCVCQHLRGRGSCVSTCAAAVPHLPAVMSKELLVSACTPQGHRRAACKRRQDAGTMSRREGCMG